MVYKWDRLRLRTFCCSVCTLTNISSSNKYKETKYKGLKITAYMCCWAKWWTIRYKRATNQLPLVKCQEQKQSIAWSLHSGTTKGVGRPPKLPLHPTQTHRFTPPLCHLRNEAALLREWRASKGAGCLFLPHLQHESQESRAWISYLASYQLLLTKKTKDLGW